MKSIKLWYSYDFANSFASSVLIFYYPLMLAERGASNVWIGVSASIATAILLFLLPYLGTWSDKTGRKIFIIKIMSVLMVASLFIIAFLIQQINTLSITMLFVLSSLYILFMVCFQGSFTFYSAMLREIANSDNNAKVSGVGLGLGQLGNVVSLSLIGPIVGSSLVIIGLSGKPLALFLGGILFALTSIPFLLQKDTQSISVKISFSYRTFLKKIFSTKRILFFIVGYALLSDSILTFQVYLTLFVKNVFDFSDKLVTYTGITGLIFGIIGGFLANSFASKLNNKEKALGFAAILYAFCFALFALVPNVPFLVFIVMALCGLSYGLVFSLARAVFSEISPKEEQAEFFSIYTVFERAASILGPLLWILTFFLLRRFGEGIQYRGAVLFLMIICLVGYYYLRKSKNTDEILVS
jgi:UMF1 family MFS transporter